MRNNTPKALTIVVVGLLLGFLLAAIFATRADSHHYSYRSGQDDAKYSVRWVCGGLIKTCESFYFPVAIYKCGSHSWCWNDGSTHVEGNIWGGQDYCGTKGRAEHGRLITSSVDEIGC